MNAKPAVASGIAMTLLAFVALWIGGCAMQRSINVPPVPVQNPQTDFAMVRTFDAPVEQVWKAWTDGEELKRWWGPRGFTCPVADMDVRVGGTSLVAMQAPPEFGGATYYNTWTYSTIIPLRRLDFVVRFTDEHGSAHHPSELGLLPGIPADVPHVLLFEPTDAGGTTLTVIEYGYESQQALDLSRQGLEQCLDKLAEQLEQ